MRGEMPKIYKAILGRARQPVASRVFLREPQADGAGAGMQVRVRSRTRGPAPSRLIRSDRDRGRYFPHCAPSLYRRRDGLGRIRSHDCAPRRHRHGVLGAGPRAHFLIALQTMEAGYAHGRHDRGVRRSCGCWAEPISTSSDTTSGGRLVGRHASGADDPAALNAVGRAPGVMRQSLFKST